jgi:hypothetical protein
LPRVKRKPERPLAFAKALRLALAGNPAFPVSHLLRYERPQPS